MFKVGDRIVYPSVGVGRIEGIVTRVLGEQAKKFFQVRIDDKQAQLMIPVDGVERLGIRALVRGKGVNAVMDVFNAAPDLEMFRTWSKRFRTYEDRLKSGNPFEIAEVLRDLMLQARRKELSFGEKKVMEMARQLLIRELAFSTESDEDSVFKKVTARVEKAWQALDLA
jgi:CarD family transcriptional regulator